MKAVNSGFGGGGGRLWLPCPARCLHPAPRTPRPPLSKGALGVETDPAELAFRAPLAARDVRWRLGVGVVAADLSARTVTLGGRHAHYRRLIVSY
jgi:NADPH-dependent 2,4-dienoyl-CoA reductase/sulfur reductase-like enzyme